MPLKVPTCHCTVFPRGSFLTLMETLLARIENVLDYGIQLDFPPSSSLFQLSCPPSQLHAAAWNVLMTNAGRLPEALNEPNVRL